MTRAARVPWHRSLSVRLFALGAVVALLAVAAATWATVRATTVAVQEEQQESFHADAKIYDALVEYAATHRSWSGAQSLVRRLGRQHDGPVTLTDTAGQVILSSDGSTEPHAPGKARARLDALDVDTALLIAPQQEPEPVTGPTDCGGEIGPSECARVIVTPTLALDPRIDGPFTTADRSAFQALQRAVRACLREAGAPSQVTLLENLSVVVPGGEARRVVTGCLDDALRAALAPYVAPPALLHMTGEGSQAEVFWDLSGPNQRRIALLAGGVLLVTLVLCAMLAATIVRPLRRMAATALRAGEGDLAARVPERRRDEIGELGRAFNRMADRREQLEEARRQMVSDVSHELRTPLANVRGWVEAARDGVVPADQELIASLHEESLHLQRLVDDLHDLALADAGELRLEPEAVELAVFLDQVASSFGAAAARAGIDLLTDCAPGAWVQADPVRLRQAVANLVANALRHTPPGGRVTLRAADGLVEVVDDGEGIPDDELSRVFERFRRVDPSRSRATGGSGLGLAIVRQIVEAHGGTATARSGLGLGTSIRLAFPTPSGQVLVTRPGGVT
ncbi:ATP-binding protein [Nocardioides sp.]|uniref:sensor histidine kinase n=1 Tax=Nocardioides sp. TaxID=35761 RepID=UPI001A214161|nr:ATP-binding protein [Nocardioides sp.]MBJ7356694.1 HAMP domain-containing histidine kinase [Nocardioides sp.]